MNTTKHLKKRTQCFVCCKARASFIRPGAESLLFLGSPGVANFWIRVGNILFLIFFLHWDWDRCRATCHTRGRDLNGFIQQKKMASHESLKTGELVLSGSEVMEYLGDTMEGRDPSAPYSSTTVSQTPHLNHQVQIYLLAVLILYLLLQMFFFQNKQEALVKWDIIRWAFCPLKQFQVVQIIYFLSLEQCSTWVWFGNTGDIVATSF